MLKIVRGRATLLYLVTSYYENNYYEKINLYILRGNADNYRKF